MTMIDDVAAFHNKFGVPVEAVPRIPATERVWLRWRLIEEEFIELRGALDALDLPETADAIADLIYVLIGTAHEFGIPLQAVWDEVQRSNMAKEGGGQDASGKIRKPPGWKAPDIEGVLREHGWERK